MQAITYYDDANPTDVFDVTSYDTKTLKLKYVEGDMWERFEKYLNEGSYGEAKIEGISPHREEMCYLAVGLAVFAAIFIWMLRYRKKHGF